MVPILTVEIAFHAYRHGILAQPDRAPMATSGRAAWASGGCGFRAATVER